MKRLRFGAVAMLGGVALASVVLALGLARPAAAADMIGNCEMTGQKGSFPFTPAVANTKRMNAVSRVTTLASTIVAILRIFAFI